MSEGADRRAFVAFVGMALLSGCMLEAETLQLRVSEQGEIALLNAVKAFARTQGFRIERGDFSPFAYSDIELASFGSLLLINGSFRCGFEVQIQDKGDWTAIFPHRSRAQIKREFQRLIENLPGVEIADVTRARRACGVS